MNENLRISIAGSGNLAGHLGSILKETGFSISQIFARNREKGQNLANALDSQWTDIPGKILQETEILFLCVKDTVIPELTLAFAPYLNPGTLIVHCSGTTGLEQLNPFEKKGVFYPLQTFTPGRKPDWIHIPLLLEGDPETLQTLTFIAKKISNRVEIMNSEQRSVIHLGAVYANNFTNLMAGIASKIASTVQVDHTIYLPLLEESIAKLYYADPIAAQTGPAKRKDLPTIEKHLEMLSKSFPEYVESYRLLSKMISGS